MTPLRFSYTNYRGVKSLRFALPQSITFKATLWHPEPQWIMTAFDYSRYSEREFALADCDFTLEQAFHAPQEDCLDTPLEQWFPQRVRHTQEKVRLIEAALRRSGNRASNAAKLIDVSHQAFLNTKLRYRIEI